MLTPSGSPTSQISESSMFTQIQKMAQKYGMAITIAMAAGGLYQGRNAETKAEQALSQSAQALSQSTQNTQTSANLVEAIGNTAGAASVLADNKSGSSDIKGAKQKLRDVQAGLKKK